MHEDEAEALRRRLYAPGASEVDLRQYRDAAPAAVRRPTVRAAGAPARRPPRPILGAAAVVVVLALALGAALLVRPPAPSLAAPTSVGLTGEDRQELLANLARGGDAGIAAYLVTHPSPPGLEEAVDPVTLEFNGAGSGTVRFDPSGVAGGGRMTVLVVLGSPGRVRWSADRLGTAGSPAVRVQRAAAREGRQEAGALTTTTFAYADGRRPVRLDVDVDGTTRWGAAVVFSR